jgi:4-amino-4-deoxy-L-arabinose transferase-like glycosyltransferase
VKGWLLKFGGPVLVLFYLVLQLAALPQAALTDDDDFYIPAGISYAEWLGKVVRFDGAFQRESIDRAFEPNHEHPPLAKYVFGLCHFAFRGWLGPTDSARVGTVLFSTLLAAAMIWLARRHLGAERGLYAGGLAVLLLLLLPRFFFHSHAATLDVPVATMYFLAAAAVLEAERRPRAGWVAGVLFGLASATKLNGPFLLLPYGLFLMLTRWGLGRGEPRDPRTFNLPRIPTTLVTMATVGPLVFLGLWPWLWFDLFQRVGAYVGFHLHHYGILFLYFGTVYSKDPHAPWHAPFTMAATTTPLAITALALVGLGFGAAVVARRLRHREGPDDDQRKEGDLILSSALHAAFAILIVAFSGGAKYGGEKLFAPFFPFWCLLAGYGALRLYEAVVTPRARALVAGVVTLGVASALALQLHFGPYALSAYNGLVSGLRGATALGFERQYYDLAFRDLVGWLSANAPPNTKVHFLPNNWEYVRTYNWYKKAGELRPDIQVVNSEREANFLVITHERRFARYGADLQRYRGRKVILEKRVDGVPIWTLLDLR